MRSLGVVTAVLCMLAHGCGNVGASCPSTVNLSTDHEHCGSCGNACSADQACTSGTCASCAPSQMLCGGTCAATDSDAANCGGCGLACNVGEACLGGECQAPCDPTKLSSPILNPWGIRWDGLERPTASLDVARVACKDFGGRLPTPTEMYRVSANQTGTVGESFHTNYLWSQAPNDKLNQATVRLSDGVASTLAALSPAPYRCVCPAVMPKTFTGAHCHGKQGSECFTLGTVNFDAANRPALRRSAAIWECTNERAHLADLPELVEAIYGGLPGSGAYIATADASDNHQSSEIRWTAATWLPANLAAIDLRTPAPFRCAGPAVATSPNPNLVANQYVGALSRYKGETADRPPATWAAAHDACTSRGGHLPRASELAELIMQGLPNGSNKALWSADQLGFDATQFQTAVNNWNGLDERHSFAFAGADPTVAAVYKTTMQSFRCIYYPLDPTYNAPAICTGGCFTLGLPGDPAPILWFDSTDRAAKPVTDALKDCAASGGHLPSGRDLTEAIRAGLPNGPGTAYLHTSDIGRGMDMIVRWTGTGTTAYADQYSANMTWSALATPHPYRCMWTNELR